MKLAVSEKQGPIWKVSLEGSITRGDPAPAMEPMSALLGAEGFKSPVLLDLSRADRLDSSGIGWLLECHHRFNNAGGKMVVHSIPAQLRQVISMMKLQKVLRLARDAEHAAAILESAQKEGEDRGGE